MRWIRLFNLPELSDDFISRSFLGVALVCLVVAPLFCVNNFLQGRHLLGALLLLVIGLFVINAWLILRHNRYSSALTLFGLVPITLFFLTVSMRQQGMIGLLWCYPVAGVFYFTLPERQAWFVNLLLLTIAFPFAWQIVPEPVAVRVMVTLAMSSAFSGIFVRTITQQQRSLRQQAVTDTLTGLLNRKLLIETLQMSTEQSRRTETPMTLVVLDIDHFKQVNDAYGHDVGDRVIQKLSELLRSRIRQVDRAFRLGGEEFLLLLYGTDMQDAVTVAESLRASIAAIALLPDRSVTVSIGIATFDGKETWQQWMKRSDENLYCAKVQGRNRIKINCHPLT